MADDRRLGEIEKSPYFVRGSTDFHEIWHAGAVRPPCPFLDGSRRHLEKSKNVVVMDIINSLLKTGIKTANKNVKTAVYTHC